MAARKTDYSESFALMDGDAVVTKGGRLKFTARTDDGLLILAYVPVDMVRESIALDVKGTGKVLKLDA